MSEKKHYKLNVNGEAVDVLAEPRELLIYTLRESLNITGPHIGCETSHCGACTVTIDGKSVKSCTMFVAQADGKEITTIEGLDPSSNHPVQQAWVENQVPQCGYCHSGQIMQAAALLYENDTPNDDDIEVAMRGNLCRCMTYNRIKTAVHRAGEIQRSDKGGA